METVKYLALAGVAVTTLYYFNMKSRVVIHSDVCGDILTDPTGMTSDERHAAEEAWRVCRMHNGPHSNFRDEWERPDDPDPYCNTSYGCQIPSRAPKPKEDLAALARSNPEACAASFMCSQHLTHEAKVGCHGERGCLSRLAGTS